MFTAFIYSLIISFLFYAFIPLLGAFIVRKSWRNFRKSVLDLSMYAPAASIKTNNNDDVSNNKFYRFSAWIEGLDENGDLFIRDASNSFLVKKNNTILYTLEADEVSVEDSKPTYHLEKKKFSDLSSYPEMTKIIVGGPLIKDGSRYCFESNVNKKCLCIIYDASDADLLPLCILSGRQKNEYWNSLTPISLVFGFFLQTLLMLVIAGKNILPLVWTLCAISALLPLLIVLPPGVLFVIVYTVLWSRARALRAERDRVLMLLRYFNKDPKIDAPLDKTVLPSGEPYYRTECQMLPNLKESDLVLLDSELAYTKELQNSVYTVFSSKSLDGNFTRPTDNLFDYIAIKGKPEQIAKIAASRARFYERISLLALAFAGIINVVLSFYLMRMLF